MLYTGLWLQVQEVSLANGAHMLGKGDIVWRVRKQERMIKDRLHVAFLVASSFTISQKLKSMI